MKDVSGYKFRGTHYCPKCNIEVLVVAGVAAPAARDYSDIEYALDYLADCMVIVRADERSFHSYDFPKIILGNGPPFLSCGKCYRSIN